MRFFLLLRAVRHCCARAQELVEVPLKAAVQLRIGHIKWACVCCGVCRCRTAT